MHPTFKFQMILIADALVVSKVSKLVRTYKLQTLLYNYFINMGFYNGNTFHNTILIGTKVLPISCNKLIPGKKSSTRPYNLEKL